mmetsp:Transcript_4325/g.10556  ORF Transcript_4325/g.10556 Transcript_4325/m.10556 type:complete len:309 (-) Transcript_4325:742-1668(-)
MLLPCKIVFVDRDFVDRVLPVAPQNVHPPGKTWKRDPFAAVNFSRPRAFAHLVDVPDKAVLLVVLLLGRTEVARPVHLVVGLRREEPLARSAVPHFFEQALEGAGDLPRVIGIHVHLNRQGAVLPVVFPQTEKVNLAAHPFDGQRRCCRRRSSAAVHSFQHTHVGAAARHQREGAVVGSFAKHELQRAGGRDCAVRVHDEVAAPAALPRHVGMPGVDLYENQEVVFLVLPHRDVKHHLPMRDVGSRAFRQREELAVVVDPKRCSGTAAGIDPVVLPNRTDAQFDVVPLAPHIHRVAPLRHDCLAGMRT